MSMSTSVTGFRPPDEKWKRMKAVYDACKLAAVALPDDVQVFFNWEPPDESGVEVELKDPKLGCVKEYREDSGHGYEVDTTKLPRGVNIIRFWNSW